MFLFMDLLYIVYLLFLSTYSSFLRFVVDPVIYRRQILDFPHGEIISPCFKPCLRTKVGKALNFEYVPKLYLQISGFKINEESWSHNFSMLTLSFDDTVEITEYKYAGLNFTKLCAEMGGALGLWLGLGIIQLFQEGLGLMKKLQQLINKFQ